MADLSLRNRAQIRQKYPELAEALEDIQNSINHGFSQVGASPVGTTPPPLPHAANSVVAGAGIVDVALTDNSQQYRTNEHFFDYTMDNWQTFHTKSLGPAKNWRGGLGQGSIQIRSYTQYPTSAPSDMLYHPPVDTGGNVQPPMQQGQGSGTGTSGYGSQPYTGILPPKRA